MQRVRLAGFGTMLAIIHAGTEDDRGIGDDRQPRELAILDVGLSSLGIGLELAEAAAEQGQAQGRRYFLPRTSCRDRRGRRRRRRRRFPLPTRTLASFMCDLPSRMDPADSMPAGKLDARWSPSGGL
jgi:hypothetical protein